MRLLCVLCATLASRTLAFLLKEPTRTIFHNFFDYNATKTFSTLAFDKTFGIEKEAKGDSVWPYLMTVHGDALTSTSDTTSLLKALFKDKIPLYRVLDKSHLQVFLAAEQIPSATDLSKLSIETQKKLPSNLLTPLPIGSRIGYDIFEQIANSPTENNQDGPSLVRFLVTLRDNDQQMAQNFLAQTRSDLDSSSPLSKMSNFREKKYDGFDPAAESSGDDLYTKTFIKATANSPGAPSPSDRFFLFDLAVCDTFVSVVQRDIVSRALCSGRLARAPFFILTEHLSCIVDLAQIRRQGDGHGLSDQQSCSRRYNS